MPIFRAMNKMPNCPTPWNKPYSTTHFHGTCGGRMNSASGKKAKVNRAAPSWNGVKSRRANFIATKFTPQTITTTSAAAKSRPLRRAAFKTDRRDVARQAQERAKAKSGRAWWRWRLKMQRNGKENAVGRKPMDFWIIP